ncbi:MAG: sigma-54 dependent transcriptional regulator [Candidatus Krumholzibacteria bacterium]|nr:sigma-54 dependent transcriptional regulator [Candidatus Krumholzibacteria bacterium]
MDVEAMGLPVNAANGSARILVVEDDASLRMIISDRLAGLGYRVSEASSLKEAMESLERESCRLALLDIFLPDQSGLEGLRRIHGRFPEMPVIVMTAHGTIDMAVEAIHEGAYDFITKPLDFKRLAVVIGRAVESFQLRTEVDYLRRATDEPYAAIIGEKTSLRGVMELVRTVADTDATVLLRGETGTGKEVIARAIHRLSSRSRRPFVVANCAAIPRELMESEMFGHVKGSFTGAIAEHSGFFETAGNGMLLLDEIGDLNYDLQAKILRVLENGTFKKVGARTEQTSSARVLASTHQDLELLIGQGRFREDLFYRLNVFPIALPPLRARREDIPEFARHFLRLAATGAGKPAELGDGAIAALVDHPWPGNVRELKNLMERLAITRAGRRIAAEDVRALLTPAGAPGRISAVIPLQDMERQAIVAALEKFGGNRTKAAQALGIGRRTLQNKLKAYGIAGDNGGEG